MVSAQSCRYSRLPASLASQPPQGCMCQVRALWEPACWRWFRLNPADTAGCLHGWQASSHEGVCVRSGPCGSQLAGDGFGSILQIQPVACIAGSQFPQVCMCQVRALWEPACWRWLRLNPADTAGCLHRWQASSHKGVCVRSGPCGSQLAGDGFGSILQIQRLPASLASQFPQGCMCQVRALWEPACWRWLRLNPADTAGCLHRWQASSHKGVCVRSGPCGSQLAGDGFGSILQIQPVPASLASQFPQGCMCQVRALWEPACWRWLRFNPADTAGACIACKPVPTRVYVSGPGPVGASLLAMASAQSCRYSRLPASLASQLPQGCMCQVRALWEPAWWRWLRLNPADTAGACIAGKPAPTSL